MREEEENEGKEPFLLLKTVAQIETARNFAAICLADCGQCIWRRIFVALVKPWIESLEDYSKRL